MDLVPPMITIVFLSIGLPVCVCVCDYSTPVCHSVGVPRPVCVCVSPVLRRQCVLRVGDELQPAGPRRPGSSGLSPAQSSLCQGNYPASQPLLLPRSSAGTLAHQHHLWLPGELQLRGYHMNRPDGLMDMVKIFKSCVLRTLQCTHEHSHKEGIPH